MIDKNGRNEHEGKQECSTIGERFEEARALFREEGYELPHLRRRSRRSLFALERRPTLEV